MSTDVPVHLSGPMVRSLLALTLVFGVGCSSEREAAAPAGPPPVPSWTGIVSMLMVEGQPPVTQFQLTEGGSEKYALFFDDTTELVGIKRDTGSVLWELGKRYRIHGDIVADENERAAAKRLSLDGIIKARHVELLN